MDVNRKLDTIGNFINGTGLFNMFLEANHFEETLQTLSKQEIYQYMQYAKVSSAIISLMFCRDNMVINQGNLIYKSNISINQMEDAILNIADKMSAGYKIDNYVEKDLPTLINMIRNKLAHGDFYIEDDNILLNKDGKLIKIDINKFSHFVLDLSNQYRINKKEAQKMQFLSFTKCDKLKIKKIDNEKVLRKALNGVTKYSLSLSPIVVRELSDEILDDYNNFIKLYFQFINKNVKSKFKNKEEVFEYYKNYFQNKGCNLNIIKEPFNEEEQQAIVDFYNKGNKQEHFAEYDPLVYLYLLGSVFYAHQANERILLKSSCYNSRLIETMNSKKIYDFCQVFKETDILPTEYSPNMPNMIVCAMMTQFVPIYIYPFEDIFVVKDEDNINFEESFDFSLLDFSKLVPNIIDDKAEVTKIDEEIDNLNRKKIKNDINLNLLNLSCNRMLEHSGVNEGNIKLKQAILVKKNQIQTTCLNINSLRNELIEKVEKQIFIHEKYDKGYYRNKTIIEGIRNSFAHGNVSLDLLESDNAELGNSMITFKDIYNGQVTFELKLKVADLTQLFSQENVNVIGNFLDFKKENNYRK